MLSAALEAKACFGVAHGAGAGMQHPFMARLANDLAGLRIATLRYQFPYMERHGKRPDTPAVCHATVPAAGAAASGLVLGLPLISSGKSVGRGMASEAQAKGPYPGIRLLGFVGFLFHPPEQPSDRQPA